MGYSKDETIINCLCDEHKLGLVTYYYSEDEGEPGDLEICFSLWCKSRRDWMSFKNKLVGIWNLLTKGSVILDDIIITDPENSLKIAQHCIKYSRSKLEGLSRFYNTDILSGWEEIQKLAVENQQSIEVLVTKTQKMMDEIAKVQTENLKVLKNKVKK